MGRTLGKIVEELAAGLSFAVVVGVVASGCNHASKASAPGGGDRAESTRGGETGPDSRLGAEPGGPAHEPALSQGEGCAETSSRTAFPATISRGSNAFARKEWCPCSGAIEHEGPPAGVVEVPFKVARPPGALRGGAVAPAGALSIAFFPDPRGASRSARRRRAARRRSRRRNDLRAGAWAYRAVVRLSPGAVRGDQRHGSDLAASRDCGTRTDVAGLWDGSSDRMRRSFHLLSNERQVEEALAAGHAAATFGSFLARATASLPVRPTTREVTRLATALAFDEMGDERGWDAAQTLSVALDDALGSLRRAGIEADVLRRSNAPRAKFLGRLLGRTGEMLRAWRL